MIKNQKESSNRQLPRKQVSRENENLVTGSLKSGICPLSLEIAIQKYQNGLYEDGIKTIKLIIENIINDLLNRHLINTSCILDYRIYFINFYSFDF